MTFLSVFLLIIFALNSVRGGEHECIGQGVQVCLDISGMDISSEEEECGVVRSSVECLRGIVNECLCDELEKKVNVGLENLETFIRTHCQTENKPSHAISLVRSDKNKCSERKAKDCLLILSNELFISYVEKCRLIRSALNCLKDTGDECLDDYSMHIRDLEKRYWRGFCVPEEEDFEDCPELLTGDYGSLRSPGYPKNYPNNMDCWTLIKVNEGKRIFFFFMFHGIWNDNCSSEYIEAFDGEDRNSLLVGRGCRFGTFNSSSNSLLVHFHSGDSNEGVNYKALYTTVDATMPPFWDASDEILEESTKCVEENAVYIFQCFSDVTALHEAQSDFGFIFYHGSKECVTYGHIIRCVIERTKNKCGETEGTRTKETMVDLLKRDADACFDTEYFEVHGLTREK